tara:strand:+ start:11360 stop:12823 length:1464 start_codon:yes stop_codon:yes gene_type:complete
MSVLNAQDISDALRYSQSEIQGTARFRALSGAFGALGGDMSAVSANPAGSAIFSQSHASFTLSNLDTENNTQYFNGLGTSSESNFDINQGGAVFVFASKNTSPWRKFTLGVNYEKTNSYEDNWFAFGTNTNNQSIDLYFLNYADGVRLGDISLLDGEFIEDAYNDIGRAFGFAHQQAFLGYQSFIIEPGADDDDNTTYFSNLGDGTFDQDYTYSSTGFNGKFTFNLATQYEDNLYLGLNLNSHFIDYQRSTLLLEDNNNASSLVTQIDFGNTLSTRGNGFSFQLGAIAKLTQEFRIGLTYDSPTWYNIEESTTQFIDSNLADPNISFISDIINVYPRYKLQTPAKVTGSLAYVFTKQGLISFDYSVKDYSKTQFKPTGDYTALNNDINNVLTSASTYRLGGEYKVKQVSFRGGYRFEESPYVDGFTVGDLTGYSLGLGYSFGNTRLDLTYDSWNRTDETPLYNVGLTDTVSIDRNNSNLTLSLSFNI